MRAVVVVGLVALLCGAADAAPKKPAKKRKGTFAAYIDPTAPDDPPRPPTSDVAYAKPVMTVVVVIDRSSSMMGGRLEAAKEVARATAASLDPNDVIAVVAVDADAHVYARPTRAGNLVRISNDIARLQSGSGSQLAPGLIEAIEILQAINTERKVIVVITDGETGDDRLGDVLSDIRVLHVPVIAIGVQGADETVLAQIARTTGGRTVALDDGRGIELLVSELRARRRK